MTTEICSSYIDGSILFDADALVQRYEITLFCSPGEFEGEPDFGIGLADYVSEPNTELTAKAISSSIIAKTEALFEDEIKILSLQTNRPQLKQITVDLVIQLIPYGQVATVSKTLNI